MIPRQGTERDAVSVRVSPSSPPMLIPATAAAWSTEDVVASAVAYAVTFGDEDERRRLTVNAYAAVMRTFPKLHRRAIVEQLSGVDRLREAVPIRYAAGWQRVEADPAPF